MSTREQILSRSRRRIKKVESIPGVDNLWVQSLTERERSECERTSLDDPVKFRAKLISFAFVDEDGDRIFSDHDIDTILDLDSAFTGRLVMEIENHCGIDRLQDEPVEELVKN